MERLRVRHGLQHVTGLGIRVTEEFVLELADPADILALLNNYRRLTREMLSVTGGDRVIPHMTAVPDDRRSA